ncbi:NADP oxidoreductase coenzyme F420-dependent [Streptomyces ipomoeae 91-03]|uniref:NADP oxidoreductase coenzyme F420-dependent n=1 Tax=Streptomyces ipomoeae 91-03 TaxID=698759 RepID=L1KT45_9ACTN|nr:NADP oxidoreductase coenzyme F420-dependent [Streptomyces ipomoeae 91-03]
MATLGFIGSGNIGTQIARLAVAAGIDVVLSNSRGPETLAETVAELGERARAATPEEAARAGDWVVVSIPLAAYRSLPAAALAGKVVLDTINYYPFRDGRIEVLDSSKNTWPARSSSRRSTASATFTSPRSPAPRAPPTAPPCPSPATTRRPRRVPRT